ncbi:helix-turn-helix domain-containing protein [Nocardia sp. BMG51109]|uniref:helix-turn-helix domain-containing protein n=1 Tax=Nocardia sp. BMG51109 TaxID=1056816 RepID=UPI000465EB66|nr:helix-turn-helix domain-containing protein [Nocardia sp. BMG51109]
MADQLDTILAAVGPRLRAVRKARGITLEQLAETTGISVSILSRLESGRRRPTLDVLLQLATAHHVALDDLVGAPATGDPRIRPRPTVRNGITWLPLSRNPGGLNAFKQIIPVDPDPPEHPDQQVHEGYEWLYLITGRLRLVLADKDFVLTAGEAAEFDTRIPHAAVNIGPDPVELLIIFGQQGERVHLRAHTAAKRTPPPPQPDSDH